MTTCIVSLALILTPAPVTARQQTHAWQTLRPSVLIAEPSVTTSLASLDISVSLTEPFGVEIEPPAPTALPVPDIPPPAPPPELTLRERALNRLAELGAPQWVVNGFDCIGFRESHWTNLRSKTGDSGVLQINDIHNPELGWLELNPWIPEQAAEYSWLLFTRRGWSFRDWVTAAGCGLR